MENNYKKIEISTENYYSKKFNSYGQTPKGVDWNSLESQKIRFLKLLDIVSDKNKPYSILDYGCGYGALLDYLDINKLQTYYGYDLSLPMIESSNKKFSKNKNIFFTDNKKHLKPVDYVVASGLLNVKQLENDRIWKEYITHLLNEFNKLSTKGFSFNCLSAYADKHLMKDYLFYGEPEYFFKFCKLNFSKNISLMHNYNLYEFTIHVHKK